MHEKQIFYKILLFLHLCNGHKILQNSSNLTGSQSLIITEIAIQDITNSYIIFALDLGVRPLENVATTANSDDINSDVDLWPLENISSNNIAANHLSSSSVIIDHRLINKNNRVTGLPLPSTSSFEVQQTSEDFSDLDDMGVEIPMSFHIDDDETL